MNETLARCDLCQNDNFKILQEFTDPLDKDNKFNLVKCSKCGLIFVNPRPTQNDMGKYYDTGYFFSNTTDSYGLFSGNRAKRISRSIPKSGNLLDIGSGKGLFLAEMKKKGWNVWGIDPTVEIRDYACKTYNLPGNQVLNAYLENAKLPEKYFDLVTMWHVFEHVHSPGNTLETINKLCKKGSILILEIPNVDSISRIFGYNSQLIDIPKHLFYFTPSTIKKMLESHGWDVEKIRHGFNIFSAFVDFKIGLLRYFGVYKNISKIKSKPYFSKNNQRGDNTLWSTLRLLFNLACLIPVLAGVVLKKSPIITVWAQKK